MIRTAQATAHIATGQPTVLLDPDNRVLAIIPADSPLDADKVAKLLNAVEGVRTGGWMRRLLEAAGKGVDRG